MFDPADPRSKLSASRPRPSAAPADLEPVGVESAVLADLAPHTSPAGVSSRFVRAQNLVVQYATLAAGARVARLDQPDEYMALVDDPSASLRVTTGDETRTVNGRALLIVPPGRSLLTALTDTTITCLYTTASSDLLPLCTNARSYAQPHPAVAPFAAWPDPPRGYRVRVYSLDGPDAPGRFGRIWRCTTMMINVLPTQIGPRDPTKLSPHVHDDFEQVSIGLEGDFVHHLRWPWGPDRTTWRNDEHLLHPSPSVAVIPPTVIHTTEAVNVGTHQLVDAFSPPRLDFSLQPGWVLNADDYPVPRAAEFS